jgi:2'-5' RNA ligase
MRPFGYAAHITFATFEAIDAARLRAALDLFVGEAPYRLRFDAISWFDATPLVLWLKPVADPRLQAMHARLSDALAGEQCSPHYRPGAWQPHCTLAMAVAPGQRDAAIAFARAGIDLFELSFDVADAVHWPPPVPVHSVALRRADGG